MKDKDLYKLKELTDNELIDLYNKTSGEKIKRFIEAEIDVRKERKENGQYKSS